jgi:formamidopyrimidine-DNA glycosylase
MAELPDLTVFAQILSRRFSDRTVDLVEVTVSKKLNVSVDELISVLQQRQLKDVKRAGKTLEFHFLGGITVGIHLMLRGELVALDSTQPPRFQIIAFRFKGGDGFAVIDMLKQATVTLEPKLSDVPDALELSKPYFKGLLEKKKTGIKTLLMDQQSMRGIGNSYADEILYHAGISPFSVANALPLVQVDKLFKSIHSVLQKAVKNIAEANGDELKGELRDFMDIHNPQLTITAKGQPIKKDKIGGRTTYYTDEQQLFN